MGVSAPMNREVNLTKRVRTPYGLRFCPVVIAANGRVKPDYVLVADKEERHPEGAYYLEWYEGSRRVRRSVGKDASTAAARRYRQEQILSSKAAGIKLADEGTVGGLLGDAVATYLDEIKKTKKPKTYAAYSTALGYFLESCTKNRVTEIDRADLLQFSAFLRDTKKLQPRTVYNKFESIMSFLKTNGIRGLVGKNDWPRYVEDEPEIYEKEELSKFFAACKEQERLWFEFFLMTGLREQEVMYCTWSEINLKLGVITVRYKPEFGFSPKAYKGREVPIPDRLVKLLRNYKATMDSGTCPLVFPTSGCRPKLDFLDTCKAIAKRAALDPSQFRLHKFRATFATWALWNGVDLRTVQQWMGHTDLESTLRYLKPNRSAAVRDRVNSMFGNLEKGHEFL
jgi:integrase/recombinase XerD